MNKDIAICVQNGMLRLKNHIIFNDVNYKFNMVRYVDCMEEMDRVKQCYFVALRGFYH